MYYLKIYFIWRKPTGIKPKTKERFTITYVSKLFVENQIKSMKRNKSAGTDEIPPGMLKNCASAIAKPVCFIINFSISCGRFPTQWKTAKVHPFTNRDQQHHRKITDLYQFCLCCQKYYKRLYIIN